MVKKVRNIIEYTKNNKKGIKKEVEPEILITKNVLNFNQKANSILRNNT